MTEWGRTLASRPIFRKLSPEDRARLVPYARIRDYAKGERILADGHGSRGPTPRAPVLEGALHADDDRLVAEMMRRDGAVDGLAVVAVVLGRHERRNQLAFTGRQGMGPRSRTSTSSLSGRAVSGLKASGPRMPGRSRGSVMCAMSYP
jgi:hypothetical protein